MKIPRTTLASDVADEEMRRACIRGEHPRRFELLIWNCEATVCIQTNRGPIRIFAWSEENK